MFAESKQPPDFDYEIVLFSLNESGEVPADANLDCVQ